MRKKQILIKNGILVRPTKKRWGQTHCMLPTPVKIAKNKFRVFYGTRNKKNQSCITFCDISFENKFKLKITQSNLRCMKPGKLGTFDDNGVLPSSIIKNKGIYYLYYIGWQPRITTRYSLLPGLALSKNLKNFKRYSQAPILKNSDREPYSVLTAPFVMKIKKKWLMWYVSCEEWVTAQYPRYNIKLAISKNGLEWRQTGNVCIKLKKNERALARPYVIRDGRLFKMWYSYEKKIGTYQIGYAESINGKKWRRLDSNISFEKKKVFKDNKMQEYPSIIKIFEKKYLLYNGNNYGKFGINFAELIQK